MPWNLLLLPLLGGFLFLRKCHYTRIKFQRFDSNRLLLESAIVGLGLLIVARIAAVSLGFAFSRLPLPDSAAIRSGYSDLAPFPYLGTALLSCVLGWLSAAIANRFVDEPRAKELAVEQTGDSLLALLAEAIDVNSAVLLTLATRKVYIGYVNDLPNLETKFAYITLVPAMSGYRRDDTLELVLTTNYIALWRSREVDIEEFLVVIPVENIKTASLFDYDIYRAHFSQKT